MIFIIGGSGFVGSAYTRLLASRCVPHVVISRTNYDDYVGQSCDVLINANGNSKKFMAVRDPKWEFDASVRSVLHSLEDFRADKYVFLSTGDVYPDQSTPLLTKEDRQIAVKDQSRYGFHKYVAEQLVRALHPKYLILRMGGFVGQGLKKNAIHDLLTDSPLWLTEDSELQFISTDTAARLVWRLLEVSAYGETVNLGPVGTVRIGDIHARVRSKSQYHADARRVRFEICTAKLAALTGEILPTATDEVEHFVQSRIHTSN